jgi:phosphoenolpyruvate-protein phosphotransferase
MPHIRLTGISAAPGTGVGRAWWYRRRSPEIARRTADDPAVERTRLEDARRAAAAEIRTIRDSARPGLPRDAVEILDAHLLMLDDPDLLALVAEQIDAGRSAEAAWWDAVQGYARRLEALPGEVFRARAADVRDVGERVVRRLVGAEPIPVLPAYPVVVVAEDLAPSDTMTLSRGRVAAICTAGGAPASHAAILARRLAIPAVVGVGARLRQITDDATILVDGDAGTVIVEPDSDEQFRAAVRQAERQASQGEALLHAAAPASTRDGVPITVAANAGSVDDVDAAIAHGADGIGLLRTEFLFLDRTREPDEEEQAAAYRAILERVGAEPVVIRTLDIGGDKPVPYLPLAGEPNPFLGVRGIRLTARFPELLRRQLRAIMQAASGRAVSVIFPMVTTVDEMRGLRALAEEARREMAVRGRGPSDLQIGMMIEVPSAALLAELFLPVTDFFSIGTNDLTQYTLAADRSNAAVAALSDGLHPAVLRLIQMVTEAAPTAGKWVGVCGELAGDELAAPVLLGLGVTELSMNPGLVPGVKAVVRRWTMDAAKRLARQALACSSAEAVRDLVRAAQPAE